MEQPENHPCGWDAGIQDTPAFKLAALIKNAEQQKSSVYLQMGETYARLHPDDYDQAFADMMKTIDHVFRPIL